MLLEFGVWAGSAYLLHRSIFGPVSDQKKIEKTFENVKFGFGDKLPQHSWTNKTDRYTIYAYNLPYGLMDNPKLELILEKTLNKPVAVDMDKQLKIRVYKEDLKMKYEYDFSRNYSGGWTVPIGRTLNGIAMHDFDKIPHMTIAGMTRQGKTVLLKLIMTHLTLHHPDDVEFYIIDLKGGLEFDQYKNLKQVKRVASNVNEAYKLLTDVSNQIKDDMSLFKSKGYTNVLNTNIKKRKFIITDEGAELAPATHQSKEQKDMFKFCQHTLSEIARVAGALGYRNIFCTQYPTSDTLPRQIKQNSDAKISFRLPTEVASRVAIDEQGAETLENSGRAIYRTHEKHIIQVPYISDEGMKKHLREWEHESTTKENTTTRTDIIEIG